MNIQNLREHLSCHCYDGGEHAPAEMIRFGRADSSPELSFPSSEIVYVFKGRVHFSLHDNPDGYVHKHELVFLPASDKAHCRALKQGALMTLRLGGCLRLCHSFSIEELAGRMHTVLKPEHLYPLHANARLQAFFEGLAGTWEDGLKCRSYLQSEIAKLLTLIRVYYPDEELCRFFYSILSPDTAFSEYVRRNHLKYPSVKALAGAANMSEQQFRRRFTAVFGQPPYRWMQQERARLVYREICMSDKTLKEIADDFGFGDKSHFNHFCNALFGMGPGAIRRLKQPF